MVKELTYEPAARGFDIPTSFTGKKIRKKQNKQKCRTGTWLPMMPLIEK